MKKLLAILFSVVMIVSAATLAFAETGSAEEPEQIKIDGMPPMAFLESEIAAGAEHHYTYTAEAVGQLTISTYAESAWSCTVTNGSNTVSVKSTDADPQINIAVATGDVVSVVVKNEGEAAATISCNVSFATAGTIDNPESIGDLHEIQIELDAIDHFEHYYTWTATEDGTLNISVDATTTWTYIVQHSRDGELLCDDWYNDFDEVVVTEVSVEVKAGDVIVLGLTNGDFDNNNTFTVKMSMGAVSTPDDDPIAPPAPDEDNSKTGDAIELVVAAMTVCALGVVVLKKKVN